MSISPTESVIDNTDSRVISHVSIPSKSVDVCSSCGSDKIARSQLEKFDSLRVFLYGQRPYRCLHCYHRFWMLSAAGRTRKRIGYVLIVLLGLGLLAYFGFGLFSSDEPDASVSILVSEPDASNALENIPNSVVNNSAEIGSAESQISPSVASQVNTLDQSESSDVGLANAEYNARNRNANDLSDEQQAKLLLQAKEQAQVAEQASKARVEQLEQILAPQPNELESLVKVEISYVLERWREAWSNGDVDTYLLAYSEDFVPADNLALATWRSARRNRVTPEKKIILKMSDFNVTMTNGLNEAVIEFDQRYQSGSYIENSRKQLSLIKQDGDWLITKEIELK